MTDPRVVHLSDCRCGCKVPCICGKTDPHPGSHSYHDQMWTNTAPDERLAETTEELAEKVRRGFIRVEQASDGQPVIICGDNGESEVALAALLADLDAATKERDDASTMEAELRREIGDVQERLDGMNQAWLDATNQRDEATEKMIELAGYTRGKIKAAKADAEALAQALEQIAGFTVAGGAGNQPHFSAGREIARAALAARSNKEDT